MVKLISTLILILLTAVFCFAGNWEDYSNDQIANAIYWAEGGAKTKYPYGILAKYKTTTPRQACLNTIAHFRRDWDGKGDFIVGIGNGYCPIGAANDPTGLNVNWVKNVKHFLLNPKEAK